MRAAAPKKLRQTDVRGRGRSERFENGVEREGPSVTIVTTRDDVCNTDDLFVNERVGFLLGLIDRQQVCSGGVNIVCRMHCSEDCVVNTHFSQLKFVKNLACRSRKRCLRVQSTKAARRATWLIEQNSSRRSEKVLS